MRLSSIDPLEAAFGPELDRLTFQELQALARRAFRGNAFLLAAFARGGAHAPLWRPLLLRELARANGADMSAAELKLLQALRALGPVANVALARAVGMDRNEVYRLVYRLRRRGLAVQTVDGYDVTDEGRRIVEATWAQQRRQQALFEV